MTVAIRILIPIVAVACIASLVLLTAHTNTATLDADAGPMSSRAATGLAVWRANNCTACHAVFGLGGHIGPDLTNVYQRRSMPYLANVISKGSDTMPDLGLDPSDAESLLAYLEHLNSLGTFPLPDLTSPPFGK